jgi:putative tricarboxylic transport membrane protein
MFDDLLLGFKISLSFYNLLCCFIGVTLGTVVGILPGLGAGATIALLLPLTFKMDVTSAIIMLAGIYYGVAYGGSATSILVNIPGETQSVVTCIDGYQMARKGRAGPALGIAAFGSFIAGTAGVIMIQLIGPPLASVALSFGPAEFTVMMVVGMTLITYLSRTSIIKCLAMATIGFILACVGLDPLNGAERFTFGTWTLLDGIGIAPLAMGIFGISEALNMAEESVTQEGGFIQTKWRLRALLPTKQDWKDSAGPITRGTFLGFFIGILPGGGAVLSSYLSYALEKRISKHPEKFGTGTIEGVAGPESANNAGAAGAFIPLLILGLPFNVMTAFLLAAFMLHGVVPGPLILQKNPEIFWGVVTSMYIGNMMLLILNLPMIGLFVNILRVPYRILAPTIALLCFVGAYSQTYNPTDVILLVFFGVVGYLMKKIGYEPAPLMLAYVIGPMFERSFRRSLILSNGSLDIFVQSPVSVVLLAVALLSVMSPLLRKACGKKRRAPSRQP